jgi:hypothetical protein
MPADDGFGFDDYESGTPTRPDSGQPNPQASIDDLGLHSSLAPKANEKGIEQH